MGARQWAAKVNWNSLQLGVGSGKPLFSYNICSANQPWLIRSQPRIVLGRPFHLIFCHQPLLGDLLIYTVHLKQRIAWSTDKFGILPHEKMWRKINTIFWPFWVLIFHVLWRPQYFGKTFFGEWLIFVWAIFSIGERSNKHLPLRF